MPECVCPACGIALADDAGDGDGRCIRCVLAGPSPVDGLRCAVEYGGVARRMLLAGKVGGRIGILDDLGRRVGAVASAAGWADGGPVVVAVPSHPWRSFARGYDPAAEIARAVAEHLGLSRARRALRRRTRRWTAVKTLGAAAREAELLDAFVARAGAVRGRAVLLIDDVVTTGATARGCARALRAAGAPAVRVAAWGRTPL